MESTSEGASIAERAAERAVLWARSRAWRSLADGTTFAECNAHAMTEIRDDSLGAKISPGQLLCQRSGSKLAIVAFEASARVVLPRDYVEFLKEMNGGEGPVGRDEYLVLWRIEDLIETNRRYRVEELAPGLLLIGSDGSGEAYALDARSTAMPVVSVPFIPLDLREVRPMAASFDAFLAHLGAS